MDHNKKIQDIIDQALTEKTFSLEVIDKIKELKDEFEIARDNLETSKETIKIIQKELNVEREASDILGKEIIVLRKFKETHEKKTREYEKTEYELEFQRNRAIEIKELYGNI